MKAEKLWSTKKKNKQNNKTYRFVPEDLYSDGKPNKDAKTSSNVAEPLCEGRSVWMERTGNGDSISIQ